MRLLVGTGVLTELPSLLGDEARTVVLVHAAGPGRHRGPRLPGTPWPAPATGARQTAVPDGEAAKDDQRGRIGLWSQLAAAGVSRTDAIVGVGGGAVTDLAGFVAATLAAGRAASCWCRPRCSA